MTDPRPSPAIPAEALARRARLHASLQRMMSSAPSLEAESLQAVRRWTSGGPFPEPDSWFAGVLAADLVEEAYDLIRPAGKGSGHGAPPEGLLPRLAAGAARAAARRAARHHLDTRRCGIRFRFRKYGECLDFDAGDLQVIFLQAFRLEGLPLALDLGKRPRPMLRVDLPLPPGVEGREEPLEAVLKTTPREPWQVVMDRLNRRLPAGLDLIHAEPLPNHASAAAELAEDSYWEWGCPAALLGHVKAGVETFLESPAFLWSRAGTPGTGALDLRTFFRSIRWEDGTLCLGTAMGGLSATNPLRALGAVVNLDPSVIQGLVRVRIGFRPDARLAQAEKYEPKLKNLYEDAVLLTGGSNITLVDEDDDEPIHLGPPSEVP